MVVGRKKNVKMVEKKIHRQARGIIRNWAAAVAVAEAEWRRP